MDADEGARGSRCTHVILSFLLFDHLGELVLDALECVNLLLIVGELLVLLADGVLMTRNQLVDLLVHL